jgi:hypothetical protein
MADITVVNLTEPDSSRCRSGRRWSNNHRLKKSKAKPRGNRDQAGR